MDKVFPFEYGCFYKIILKPTDEDRNKLNTIQTTDTLRPSFTSSYSYDSVSGVVEGTYLAPEFYFLPIAFQENTQKITLEAVVYENERLSGLLSIQNSQMQKVELTKNNKRIARLEIDAPLFIRNFEKVL